MNINEKFIKNRIIFLSGDLNSEDIINTIKTLHLLDEKNEDIKIYVSCNIGDYKNALMLHDVIKNLKSNVITYLLGYTIDYSIFIFLAGQERIALEHSKCITPKFNLETFNKKSSLDIFIKLKNNIIKNIKNTFYNDTNNYLDNFLEDTCFMTTKELIKNNIATEIKEINNEKYISTRSNN